jgi:hypothetical protein
MCEQGGALQPLIAQDRINFPNELWPQLPQVLALALSPEKPQMRLGPRVIACCRWA